MYVFKTSLLNHSFATKLFRMSQMILLFLCSRKKSPSLLKLTSKKVKFWYENHLYFGKSMIMFVFVNCPRVKNQASRFTIDNNFFDSTYRAPRYFLLFLSEFPRIIQFIFFKYRHYQTIVLVKKRNTNRKNQIKKLAAGAARILIFYSSPPPQNPKKRDKGGDL